MKKLLGVLLVAALFLAACGNEAAEPENGGEQAETRPYYVHLIGGPEYYGWFDYIKEMRSNSEEEIKNKFEYYKIDSALDTKGLVKKIANNKQDKYRHFILIGLGPDDYEGGTKEDATNSFNKLKGFVNESSNITLENNIILLIGNGYPKTEAETDEHLLWNHERMRLFLKDRMESTNMIYNFSVKRPLSDDNGYLNNAMTEEEINNQLSSDLETYLTLIKKRL